MELKDFITGVKDNTINSEIIVLDCSESERIKLAAHIGELKDKTILVNAINFETLKNLLNIVTFKNCLFEIEKAIFKYKDINNAFITQNRNIVNVLKSLKTRINIQFAYISSFNFDVDYFEEISGGVISVKEFAIQNFLYANSRMKDISYRFDIPFTSVFSGNLNNSTNPLTESIRIEGSEGTLDFNGMNITLAGGNLNLKVRPGTVIKIVEPTNCNIIVTRDEGISIFFKGTACEEKSKINLINGYVSHTNGYIDITNKRKNKLYRFKRFENVDFSDRETIDQFFGCIFINCCFNENQYILNSKIFKSYFLSKVRNVEDCEIVGGN